MENRRAGTSGWHLVAVLLLVGLSFYLLRGILTPFVLAAGLAYVANPLVRWFERRLRLPRLLAVLLLYLVVLGPSIALGFWLVPVLLTDIGNLAANAPAMISQLSKQLLGTEKAEVLGQTIDARAVSAYFLGQLQALLGAPAQITQLTIQGIVVILSIVLTLVVLGYLLADEEWLLRSIMNLAPPASRPRLHSIVGQIDRVLGRYLRGLLIIIVYASSTTWLGLGLLFHLPYAIPIALATGLLELVPGIGPITSWAIASVVALIHGGFWTMIQVVVFYGLLRLSLDPFVGPIVLGRAVTLHPVVILFALLAGGALLGTLGVIIAIPAAAILKVIFENWHSAMPEG